MVKLCYIALSKYSVPNENLDLEDRPMRAPYTNIEALHPNDPLKEPLSRKSLTNLVIIAMSALLITAGALLFQAYQKGSSYDDDPVLYNKEKQGPPVEKKDKLPATETTNG